MISFAHPRTHGFAFILLVSAVLILAACGGAGSTNNQSTQEEPAPAPQESAAVETPEPQTVAEMDPVEASGPAAALASADRNGMYDAPPPMQIDPARYYYATLRTDKGDIRIQLFADRAPQTVNNFVYLARQGFYDETTFHRVLDGFMAQGGDPTGTGAGGPGYEFADEFFPGLVFDRAGLLAMANRGPGTNGSQFFITFAPTEHLNNRHTIFGEVIEGGEVLAQITRRDPGQNPDFPGDTILTVTIDESDESTLPTPSPPPPTATPTPTPTPFAPTDVDAAERPLATVTAEERVNYFNTAPDMVIDPEKQYQATIKTSRGDLVVDLYADQAPVAVNNFVVLAELGFYDGVPVNGVVNNQAVVIGAPDNNPINDVGYQIAAETGLEPDPQAGSVAYIPFQRPPEAAPVSSGSQILIALIDPPAEAAGEFSFFGQVVDGLDVLTELTMDDTVEAVTITAQ